MSSPFDIDDDELTALLGPSYRVAQFSKGIFGDGKLPDEITSLPARLRSEISDRFRLGLTEIARVDADSGRTVKWLFEVEGGGRIETVLMHYRDRSTACISSQAGCAMGCSFCATGQGGFGRQLSRSEILEQVFIAKREARPARLSNVVLMGMGEPLANYRNVVAALRDINARFGLSARKITLSTVGLVPGLLKLAGESIPLTLAISLHAANDSDRDSIIPLNRRYPIGDIISACEVWTEATSRLVSFEWAMIRGFNDTTRAAEELAALAMKVRAHVNLIPLNPTPGYPVLGSEPERIAAFKDRLESLGVRVSIRNNRGRSIEAACGQLAMRDGVRAATRPGLRLTPPTTGANPRPNRAHQQLR